MFAVFTVDNHPRTSFTHPLTVVVFGVDVRVLHFLEFQCAVIRPRHEVPLYFLFFVFPVYVYLREIDIRLVANVEFCAFKLRMTACFLPPTFFVELYWFASSFHHVLAQSLCLHVPSYPRLEQQESVCRRVKYN